MRWKAYHFLNPTNQKNTNENYGFKSRRSAPHVKELVEFEDTTLNIKSIEFKPNTHPNELQKKAKTRH